MATRVRFLVLATVSVCISLSLAAAFAGSALGYAVFLGSGLLAGVTTAWMIARRTTHPRSLLIGAIFTATVSLAAPLLAILLIFGIAGAGH